MPLKKRSSRLRVLAFVGLGALLALFAAGLPERAAVRPAPHAAPTMSSIAVASVLATTAGSAASRAAVDASQAVEAAAFAARAAVAAGAAAPAVALAAAAVKAVVRAAYEGSADVGSMPPPQTAMRPSGSTHRADEFAIPTPPEPVTALDFREQQLTHSRVRNAYLEKGASAERLFALAGLPFPPTEVYLRAFKREQVIELWARSPESRRFVLVKQYAICALSGKLGPKRTRGDRQIPEGFYRISAFNATSAYHLSLKIDYPNRVDRTRGRGPLGGDIFIHGDCVTVGCLPITDEEIKELYWIVVEARAAGQTDIPVHIFPARLDAPGLAALRQQYGGQAGLMDFWMTLKPGFDAFERNRLVPEIAVDAAGRYRVVRQPRVLGEPALSTPSTEHR